MADDTSQTNGSGPAEGARRATGAGPERAAVAGPLEPNQRWTVTRKREVVLRLLRGEPIDAVGREVGVEGDLPPGEVEGQSALGHGCQSPRTRWGSAGEGTVVGPQQDRGI